MTTLLTVINKDLCHIPTGEVKLNIKNGLDHLRPVAEDRTQWRRLSANTVEETVSEYPRGNQGVQVGALGCERRYKGIKISQQQWERIQTC